MRSGMERKSRTARIEKALFDLAKKQVLVGIPAENAGNRKTPISNAEIGYLMETGSPSQNIPARPFARPGIAAAKVEIKKHFKAAIVAAVKGGLRGNASDVDVPLSRAGLAAQISIQREISSNVPPPLAASTIAKRRARGRTGNEQTLVDTGQLRRAITYVIRAKRGR